MSALTDLRTIGIVVHPTRSIDGALDNVRGWADEHDVEVAQVRVDGQQRRVADERDAADCDLIAAIGGDGTMLAATSAAARADKPVVGIACGSLGVLTSVSAGDAAHALQSFADGDWEPRPVSGLDVLRDDGDEPLLALNDVAITRQGQGQVTTSAEVDGVLYARFVGDGFVVTTPIGSSGYTLAAGGPLLAPGAKAFALTPLAKHGGCAPPLVIGSESTLVLDVEPGYGGVRLEHDGRPVEPEAEKLTITLRPDAATIVGLADAQSILTGLRRKKIIIDSPRVMAREAREAREND
jgi:NAD+ kinase